MEINHKISAKRSKEVSINSMGKNLLIDTKLVNIFCKMIHEFNNISSVSHWYINICGCDRIKKNPPRLVSQYKHNVLHIKDPI